MINTFEIGDIVIVNEPISSFDGCIGPITYIKEEVVGVKIDANNIDCWGYFNHKNLTLVSRDRMRKTRLNSNFVKKQEEFNNIFTSYSNYRKTKDEVESGEWFTKNFQWDWRRIGLASVLVLATIYSGYIGGLLCMVGAIAASVLTIYLVRPKGVLEYISANPHKEFKTLEQND